LKTPKERFIELFHASGWSQAEVARRINKTRGGINGIVTGNTKPSPSAVKLLKHEMVAAGKLIPAEDSAFELRKPAESAWRKEPHAYSVDPGEFFNELEKLRRQFRVFERSAEKFKLKVSSERIEKAGQQFSDLLNRPESKPR
jgi:transcriptional regulator with XRE-family HTH domain